MSELKSTFLSNGWTEETERVHKSELFSEDWGWCVFLRYQGQLVLIGLYVHTECFSDHEDYSKSNWLSAGLTFDCYHKRSFREILLGKNKLDDEVFVKTYLAIWEMLSGLSYIRELSSTEQPY